MRRKLSKTQTNMIGAPRTLMKRKAITRVSLKTQPSIIRALATIKRAEVSRIRISKILFIVL